MKTLILALLILLSLSANASKLKSFTTDYCSNWPEGTKEDPTQWADCCFTHDLYYWVGGTEIDRKNADQILKKCIKISSSSLEAFLMYMAVRMGGKPGDATYAWGYGWIKSRGYEKIQSTEIQIAKELLETSEYNQKENTKPLITNFIDEVLSIKD